MQRDEGAQGAADMESTAAYWCQETRYVQHLLVLEMFPALLCTALCVVHSKDTYKQEVSNKQHIHAYGFVELLWDVLFKAWLS